jgi:HAD superfamily hydrolase (TIGR01549 family)
MTVRAVLFDLFDTLVDLYMENLPEVTIDGRTYRYTTPMLHAELRKRAPELAIDMETFARELGEVDRGLRSGLEAGRELPTIERFRGLVERLALTDPELPEALTQTHMDSIAGLAASLPHHTSVLAALGRDYKLGVCSNFSHTPTAVRVLDEAGLLRLFDCVAISEEVGFRKPHPEIFRYCLDALGVSPEETVHVGDRLHADVLGAAELGIRPIWITRRVTDTARDLAGHEGPPPAAVISDLAELPSVLASI